MKEYGMEDNLYLNFYSLANIKSTPNKMPLTQLILTTNKMLNF